MKTANAILIVNSKIIKRQS